MFASYKPVAAGMVTDRHTCHTHSHTERLPYPSHMRQGLITRCLLKIIVDDAQPESKSRSWVEQLGATIITVLWLGPLA